MDGNIAVINIHGPLIKRASGFLAYLLGIIGMETLGNIYKAALADDDVDGIFMDIDCAGSTVDGTMTFADIVYNGRRESKPVLAFADGQMTSGAQWIGSGADYVIMADETTRVGSIGVYGVHFSYADKVKELGISPTVFHSGRFKSVGNQLEHLSETDKVYIQENFDYTHEQFIKGISRNTGISVRDLDTDLKEAKVFLGSRAVKVGLANEIADRDSAMKLLKDVVSGRKSFNRKPVAVKHRATSTRTESKGGYSMSKIQNFNLKSLAESIQEATDLPGLKAIEDQCLLHFSEAEKTASNWLIEEKVKSTSNHVKQLVDIRRRQLLALPQIQKAHADYELGMAVGKR
jgi:signal peptide peptidase SppA